MNATRASSRHGPARVLAAVALLAATAAAQSTTRVSVDSAGGELPFGGVDPTISGDGQVIAFASGDSAVWWPVLVRDRTTGLTESASVDSAGAPANGPSSVPAISADGLVVAFTSTATNLVAGDTNGAADVFVHDRGSGATERVSVDSAGVEGDYYSGDYSPDGKSPNVAISANGQFVAFRSWADNLVAGDTNGVSDIFVHDRVSGSTERVSVDSSGMEGDYESFMPSISADGRYVAFASDADNLVAYDTNGVSDIFVRDRINGTTERVSVNSAGNEAGAGCRYEGPPLMGWWVCRGSSAPSISADGNCIAFASWSPDLVANDTNALSDIFVHDRASGITERVSVDSSGAEANSGYYSSYYWGSGSPSISGDGQVVAFQSDATNLVPGDTNDRNDVFVHDRMTRVTLRANLDSSGAETWGGVSRLAISADGQAVAFSSGADNIVSGDTNGYPDAFVRELHLTDASWTNYGAGFPGTYGVPSFTSRNDPVLGTNITLDLANSYGWLTPGLLFIGFQRASIHSGWGGDLLVAPALTLVLGLSPSGLSLAGDLPADGSLYGVAIELQAIEIDRGAAKGVSFTEGLELVLGR